MPKRIPRGYRVEVEACGFAEIRRTLDRSGVLVSAELWHKNKRLGWRLVRDPYDDRAMRYATLDGLGAYIHSDGVVGYYTAWGDGEVLSREEIDRDAWLARCEGDMRERAARIGVPKGKSAKELMAEYRRVCASLDELESAERAYALEHAIVVATSTWTWADPLGPRTGDLDYLFSRGLAAFITALAREGRAEDAAALFRREMDDEDRMRARVAAHRDEAKRALAAGVAVCPDLAGLVRALLGRDNIET
jgi:hypothetical protein